MTAVLTEGTQLPRRRTSMSMFQHQGRRVALLLTAQALAISSVVLASPTAHAGRADRDGDGMPNRWEASHGLNPDRANALADKDDDGLSNRGEYRHGGHPTDEDSDNDGHDDGDEVRDGYRGTRVDDRDSDDDGVRDGDEDHDDDGVANEDEDDSRESCDDDDDDRDEDNISDEDENDYRYRAGDDDSDDDGIPDGDEDRDGNGVHDEDDDDSDDDRCSDADEDSDDRLGTIVSFDTETFDLVIETVNAGELTFRVTDKTEIEFDSSGRGSGEEGSTEDLVPGAVVAEIDLEEDGTLEEIELARS